MSENQYPAIFQEAFNSFLEKVKQDPAIIAVYLYGSLVRGDMWEGSDLDVYAITRDERADRITMILVENGITFHCDVVSRGRFRRIHERMLRGSTQHHIFTSGELVYTTDESLQEYFDEMAFVGERDRELVALYHGTSVIAYRHSVRKSYHAHEDAIYMYLWLLDLVRQLAGVEIALQGESVERETLHQALQLNPEVFEPIIHGLLYGSKDLASLMGIFSLTEAYMEANATRIFKPLLAYLAAEGEVRGISEIYQHLSSRLPTGDNNLFLFDTCTWLVKIGLLEAVESPIKLTPRSQSTVDEPAYFYDEA